MTTIKGNPQVAASFDKLSQNLKKTADSLDESAREQLTGPETQVSEASAKAVYATSKFVEGISDTAAASAQVAAAGGFVAPGVNGWVVEGMRPGGREVARGVGRGLGSIAQTLPRIFGGGRPVTVHELQGDPTAQRFSERTFGKAAAKLQLRSDEMNAAWSAYGEALEHLSGVGGGLLLAAGNAAGVAVNLGKAAALTTSSGATKMAEYGVRIGAAALHAAEAGVPGARELLKLSARFSASAANVIANPDAGAVKALVDGQLQMVKADLGALLASDPGLQPYLAPLLAK